MQQDEDGREATQGCDCRDRPSLSGILPEALDHKGDLRVVYPKATELGFCTPKPARQPPGHTQAFVALHRASGAGSEAPASQDKPLRVTGASPQQQTLQRLGDGYAELVKASEPSGWASSSHWGSQLPLTGYRVESGLVGALPRKFFLTLQRSCWELLSSQTHFVRPMTLPQGVPRIRPVLVGGLAEHLAQTECCRHNRECFLISVVDEEREV